MDLEVKLYSFIFVHEYVGIAYHQHHLHQNYKTLGLRFQYTLKYCDKPGPQIHLLRGV